MYYVYVLKSDTTGKHYIGSTGDLNTRLKQHNNNVTRSIKNRGPYKLVHTETFTTCKEARQREKVIKLFKGNRQFKRLINTNSSVV